MRGRALLLALVAGGVTAGAGVAFSAPRTVGHDAAERAVVLARPELADVQAPRALTRLRVALDRDPDSGRGVVEVFTSAFASILAAASRIARERSAAARSTSARAIGRPRAPPRVPVLAHC